MDNQISEKTKRRVFTVSLILKKNSKFLKESDKSENSTLNVKLTSNSVCTNSLKCEV